MSLQAFSRIGLVASRQTLGRLLPRQAVGQRSIFYTQQKRASTSEELGVLVLGLGLLSFSVVWGIKEGAFSIQLTPDEVAKLREQEAAEQE